MGKGGHETGDCEGPMCPGQCGDLAHSCSCPRCPGQCGELASDCRCPCWNPGEGLRNEVRRLGISRDGEGNPFNWPEDALCTTHQATLSNLMHNCRSIHGSNYPFSRARHPGDDIVVGGWGSGFRAPVFPKIILAFIRDWSGIELRHLMDGLCSTPAAAYFADIMIALGVDLNKRFNHHGEWISLRERSDLKELEESLVRAAEEVRINENASGG